MKPLTRKEIFENAIAEGKQAPIEPVTREEMILAAHAKREASGGSGGGVGGALDLIIFTENQDTYEWSCNKTFDECLELVNNGVFIAVKRRGSSMEVLTNYHRFESVSGTELYFTYYNFDHQRPTGVMWVKDISGEIGVIYGDYAQSME